MWKEACIPYVPVSSSSREELFAWSWHLNYSTDLPSSSYISHIEHLGSSNHSLVNLHNLSRSCFSLLASILALFSWAHQADPTQVWQGLLQISTYMKELDSSEWAPCSKTKGSHIIIAFIARLNETSTVHQLKECEPDMTDGWQALDN